MDPKFYLQPTKKVAQLLLGQLLCVRTSRGVVRTRIVETEAYLGIKDPACHTFAKRKTQRNKSMYLQGGHCYVYFIYGMYFCFNIVTRDEQSPEAVLIRGVEPLDWTPKEKSSRTPLPTNGPGKLCRYLEIDHKDDGLWLGSKKSRIWIEQSKFVVKKSQIIIRERVGIDSYPDARDWPLRFYLQDNPFVSRK